MYPTDEETFDARVSPEWVKEGHLNSIQAFLKRLQDFLGYGGRLNDKTGLVMPVGAIIEYPDVSAPTGWLLCNGKEYDNSHADYIDLYAVIGDKYGARDGSYFNVPDKRHMFSRGYGKIIDRNFLPENISTLTEKIAITGHEYYRAGMPVRFSTTDTLFAPIVINTTYYTIWYVDGLIALATNRANALAGTKINITSFGVGTHTIHSWLEQDEDSRIALTTGGNTGEDLGSYQITKNLSHRHKVFATRNVQSGTDYRGVRATSGDDDVDTGYTGDHESRPYNVNVNYIIKR